jgi:hypothetical protein
MKGFLVCIWYSFIIKIILLILFIVTAAPDLAHAANIVTIRPISDEGVILFNPGAGLVINNEFYQEGAPYNAWRSEVFNIAYNRFRWKDLEPEEGVYDFSVILNWMRPWRKAGYRVAFGVKSTDMEMTCTPEWVFKAGVPAVSHRGGKQKDPVYWHPLYMQKYLGFIKKIGEAFEGMDGLEYVDMRGIGVWGEMHLGTFFNDMWNKEEMSRYGYTDDAYKDAYRKMIDAYRIAFPTTRLFLNIGSHEDLANYAVSRKVGLRSDALSIKPGSDLPVVSRQFQKYCFNDGKRGVPCHYESAFECPTPLLFTLTIDAGLRDPISYLFANPGDLHNSSPEIKEILKSAARKVGYRLVPISISIESGREVSVEESIEINVVEEWLNRGVAPTYFDFDLVFSLIDSNGGVVHEEIVRPSLPTSAWRPLQLVKFQHSLKLPSTLEGENYILALAVLDPKRPGSRVELGITGIDAEKRYPLAMVSLNENGDSRRVLIISEMIPSVTNLTGEVLP